MYKCLLIQKRHYRHLSYGDIKVLHNRHFSYGNDKSYITDTSFMEMTNILHYRHLSYRDYRHLSYRDDKSLTLQTPQLQR